MQAIQADIVLMWRQGKQHQGAQPLTENVGSDAKVDHSRVEIKTADRGHHRGK